MTAEVLKNDGDLINDQLITICQLLYQEQKAPSQWMPSLIVPIPKKRKLRTNDKF